MKKINHIVLIALISSVGFLTNCKKKKEEEILPPPTVTIDSVPGSARNQAFYGVGNPIRVDYKVNSSDNLSGISITETFVPASISGKSTARNTYDTPTSYAGPYNSTFPSDAEKLTITILANDVKGKSATKEFIAKKVISDRLIGASSYENGKSFFSSTENKYYNASEFDANKNNIDITFDYLTVEGATNNAPTLLSSDERNNLALTTGINGIKTYFKESTLNFTSATAADIYNIQQSDKQYVTLTVGSVYEFVSPTLGTKGIILVKAATNAAQAASNTMTFDIKSIKYK